MPLEKIQQKRGLKSYNPTARTALCAKKIVCSLCLKDRCAPCAKNGCAWPSRNAQQSGGNAASAVREGDSNPMASRSTRHNNHKLARMNWGVRVWDPNLLLLGDLLLELVATKDRTTVPALQEKLCKVTCCGGGGPRPGSSEWFG